MDGGCDRHLQPGRSHAGIVRSVTLVAVLLAQATAEYVVSVLARAGHALTDAIGAGWSFVGAHPWASGIAVVLVIVYLARR